MIRPSFLECLLGVERVSHLLQWGLAVEKTELRKVTCLRRGRSELSGNLTLLDRVSYIVLILRADISTDETNP